MLEVTHGPSKVKLRELVREEGLFIAIEDWDLPGALFEFEEDRDSTCVVNKVGGLWVWTLRST